MPKAKRKVSAKQILMDIRSGMTDSQLKKKYTLSSSDLKIVQRKLYAAGLLERPLQEGVIPEDRALVPVEKKARDVPRDRDSRERRRRLQQLRRAKKIREQSEQMLKIMDSTFHWWLIGIGLSSFVVGSVLYLAWPLIQDLWMEDLALDRVLDHYGAAQQSYELWRYVSKVAGPIMAALGGLIAGAGLLQWRWNTKKIKKLINLQRQGLVFTPSRDQ